MIYSKKICLCGLMLLLICQYSFAQLPEDALRLSWNTPSGTARQQAIGGAIGSLGGEISAVFVNPAGLGMYKNSEFVISPGFRFLKNNTGFRGTDVSGSTTGNFNLGTSGLVAAFTNENGSSNAFSIAVNQTSSFKNNLYYQGQNDYSSFSEQFAEEFANSGLSINDAINSSAVSYGTRMALYSYLIDTATINGTNKIIAMPEKAGLLNQQNSINSRGSITEIAFAYAGNFSSLRKCYFGGTLCIPIVVYKHEQTFVETDATGNTNNDFASMIYQESYSSSGFGLNFKAGAIFKAADNLQFGASIISPSGLFLKDHISSSMITNTENYAHVISISSTQLDAGSGFSANQVKYILNTNWKFLLSGSYIFGGGEQNIKQQKGFITADIGWITNRTMKYSGDVDENGNSTVPNGYFDGVNSAIKSIYKNSFDVHVGGELKFNLFAARLGFAYYTNPNKQGELKTNRMYFSGGVGYRNKGMFIDLTYVESIANDINFPYRLSDKSNTYATIKQTAGTILVTVGFKLL